MEEAFAILRDTSRTTNTRLTVLADHLLDGRITAVDLLPPPARPRDPSPTATATAGVRSAIRSGWRAGGRR